MDGGAGAVVDDIRRTLAGAGLGEIDPDPLAAAHDELGLHAFGAQRAHGRLADLVRRQPRHIVAVEAEPGEED